MKRTLIPFGYVLCWLLPYSSAIIHHALPPCARPGLDLGIKSGSLLGSFGAAAYSGAMASCPAVVPHIAVTSALPGALPAILSGPFAPVAAVIAAGMLGGALGGAAGSIISCREVGIQNETHYIIRYKSTTNDAVDDPGWNNNYNHHYMHPNFQDFPPTTSSRYPNSLLNDLRHTKPDISEDWIPLDQFLEDAYDDGNYLIDGNDEDKEIKEGDDEVMEDEGTNPKYEAGKENAELILTPGGTENQRINLPGSDQVKSLPSIQDLLRKRGMLKHQIPVILAGSEDSSPFRNRLHRRVFIGPQKQKKWKKILRSKMTKSSLRDLIDKRRKRMRKKGSTKRNNRRNSKVKCKSSCRRLKNARRIINVLQRRRNTF